MDAFGERFVPTAVVTAFRVEFDPDEAIALGALAYADQPLSSDTLLTTARVLIRPPSHTMTRTIYTGESSRATLPRSMR